MKITVVTICLNAEKTIERTMQSVLGQTFQEMEYLIIDGKSNDGTLDIVNSYMNDERICLLSEKDSGLYNAMNKAIDLSTGDYIIFMNSGDMFCDNYVLEDMVPYLQSDLVYGNVIRKTQSGDRLEKYHGKYKLMHLLLMGRMMSHQALFTKSNIMAQYKFNEQFKICADYDFIVRAKKNRCSITYIDRTVCIMDNIEGISAQIENLDQMRSEDDRSLRENYRVYYYILKIPKGILRFFKRKKEYAQLRLNAKNKMFY